MQMGDINTIIPDHFKRLGQRKLVAALVILVAVLAIICVVLASLLGAHRTGSHGAADLNTSSGAASALIDDGSTHWIEEDDGQSADSSAGNTSAASTCLSVGCLKSSAWLASNMDTVNAKPCDNFYRWACGGWEARTSVAASKASVSLLSQARDATDAKLRDIIQSPIYSQNPSSTEMKLKSFFQMCIHDYGRMKDGATALLHQIQLQLGSWYVLDPDGWKAGWNINDALVSLQSDFVVNALMSVNVFPDSRNSNNNIISISYGGMGMWYSNYQDTGRTDLQDAYKDYMRSVVDLAMRDADLKHLDSVERDRRAQQFVDDVYSQESHLAQAIQTIRMAPGWRMESTVVTLRVLKENFTQVDWSDLITRMFPSVSITDDTEIQVRDIQYFNYMDELLRNESTEGSRDRIMNNYVVWQLMHTYGLELSWEYKYASFRYYETLYGMTQFGSTWEHCMQTVKARMGSALAAEFLAAHIGEHGHAGVRQMFDGIKSALHGIIDGMEWMDAVTRTAAQEKLNYVEALVGFPDSYFDHAFVDELHSKLVIDTSASYFQNLLNINQFYNTMQASKLMDGRKYYLWSHTLKDGDFGNYPTYFWKYNKLLVPAGSMQFPLYATDMPAFMAYGAIGSVIGLELVSSINDIGRYTSHNGSFVDWWSQDTSASFAEHRDCYHDVLHTFTAEPYLVNGSSVPVVPVAEELQADELVDTIMSITMAYRAYETELLSKEDLLPPGLNLTNAQAFFLSAAQMQCTKRRDESSHVEQIAKYGWAPHAIMLNTALTQMNEFHEAFQCPADSNMNMNTQQMCELF